MAIKKIHFHGQYTFDSPNIGGRPPPDLYIGGGGGAVLTPMVLFVTSQYLWKFHSLLFTKPGSLLLPPPLFSKPVAPLPPPTHPWRKLVQQHKTP